MNVMQTALLAAGVTRAGPMQVLVLVEDYRQEPVKLVREYVFDYNNDHERRTFAAQSRAALEAGQAVSTQRVDA